VSGAGARVTVSVQAGVEVRRVDAIHGVLRFVIDVLRLGWLEATVEKGVRQNQWLTMLRIVGLDSEERIAEELVFAIDWDRHQLHMAQGRGTVAVPNGRSLVAFVSPDLLTALRLFKEACFRKELVVTCFAAHRDTPGGNASAELGLGGPVTLKYAGAKLQAPVGIGELDEVSGSYNRYGPT